ncbi:MAG: hypothetical protein NC223_01710 [Butyrivibrio sp.]|nr:hypothetical protein [Butyrivibrio sp.]
MKKKLIVLLTAATMVIATALTGCGTSSSSSSKSDATSGAASNEDTKAEEKDTTAAEGNDETKGEDNAAGDWKNKDFADWNADDLGQYFIDNGTFSEADWYYVQKNEYVEGTGFDANISYFDEDTAGAMVMIMWFNPDSEQSNRDETYDYIKNNQATPEDCGSVPVDHLVGNFAFSYTLCADNAEYDKMDAAYKAFIEEFNLTPEF